MGTADGDPRHPPGPMAGITTSKFHQWKKLHGKVNEHNGWIPRDWSLEDWEKQAIIYFQGQYPLGGIAD